MRPIPAHRWFAPLVCLLLGPGTLAACSPTATAPPTLTSPAASPPVATAPPTLNSPAASPPVATAPPTLTSPPTKPVAATPGHSLPTTAPWLISGLDSTPCGIHAATQGVSAIAPDGSMTALDMTITAIGWRQGAPPLLATCDPGAPPTIIDPLGWTRTPLNLTPGLIIFALVPAPDGRRALAVATCPDCSADEPSPQGHLVDLTSGATSPFPYIQAYEASGPYSASISQRPIRWGGQGIYVEVGGKGYRALDLVSPDSPNTSSRKLVEQTVFELSPTADRLAFSKLLPDGSTALVLADLARGTTQAIDQAVTISSPTFTPDGDTLAYFRSSGPSLEDSVQLVRYNLETATQTVLPFQAGWPATLSLSTLGNSALIWSQDGQRLIALTQPPGRSAFRASLLSGDGTLINAVDLPQSIIHGVTADDQLLLVFEGDQSGLRWLPLRQGGAPYAPAISLPMGRFISAAVLPQGNAGLPAVTPPPAAAPPPVTQLPTPAIPTPLAAVTLAATPLGPVPDDGQLLSSLPLSRYAVYQDAAGVLYAQPLAGGPAVPLAGGTDEGWGSLVAITPDGEEAIVGLTGGLFRIGLADGARTPLAAPPPEIPGATIIGAQLSPDGAYVVYQVSGPKPEAWREQMRDNIWPVALYGVPIAGGAPTRLSPPLDPESATTILLITPDSRSVIYTVDVPDPNGSLYRPAGQVATRTIALYSVPIAGGAAIHLADSPSAENPIQSLFTSADGRYLLFEPRSASALYSVSVAGGAPAQLSVATDQQIISYELTPDRQAVLYTTGMGAYVVPLAGGAPSMVSEGEPTIAAGLTPGGREVVLRTQTGVYRVPVAGGAATRLAELAGEEVFLPLSGLAVTEERALYPHQGAILSVPIAGGPAEQVSPTLGAGDELLDAQLSPDRRYLLMTVKRAWGLEHALYSAPTTGGPATLRLSGATDIVAEAFGSDVAIVRMGEARYALPLAGGTPALITATASTWPAVLTADGRHVVFAARGGDTVPQGVLGLSIAALP